MKDYAAWFYKGAKWQKVSAAYMASKNYMCERCGAPGKICHHKTYITPHNIMDPAITYNFDNLECLCQDCHNKEHTAKGSRAQFDEHGNITRVKESADIKEFKKQRKAYEQAQRARRNAYKPVYKSGLVNGATN